MQITEKALIKLKQICEDEGLENQYVRAKVMAGGCAGFSYDLSFDPIKKDTDEVFTFDSIILIVDPISHQYLEGSTIDWVDHNLGGAFRFINPNSKGSCGCQNSFSF